MITIYKQQLLKLKKLFLIKKINNKIIIIFINKDFNANDFLS